MAMPIDPESREERQRDPVLWDAMERLQDANEQLTEALQDRVNETGLLLRQVRPGPERLDGARARLAAAKAQWSAALAEADGLLGRRQNGGE